MEYSSLILILVGFSLIAFYTSRVRASSLAKPLGGVQYLSSLPFFYGMRSAIWCAVPALAFLILWALFDDHIINTIILDSLPDSIKPTNSDELSLLLNSIENISSGALPSTNPDLVAASKILDQLNNTSQKLVAIFVLSISVFFICLTWMKVSPKLHARHMVEKFFRKCLLAAACIAILATLGIVFSVIFEAIRFFQFIPVSDFLLGTEWSPQMAIRSDQVGSSGSFGAIPLFVGTLLISFIAMCIAVPVGLMSAVYLAEYAKPVIRSFAKPVLEILAGIPTVVYGFFAALTVTPFLREHGTNIGLDISSESALSAGLVMGVMIIPFISSLADDVITAVPQSLRDGSLGLGATKSETIKKVIFPAALPGIVGGVLLAVSRAIGETMIVVMAAGLAAKLTINPLETVTTVTVQIVTLLVGDQEFDSPKTLAAFALGLMLFFVTLALNFVALRIVNKYREQYD